VGRLLERLKRILGSDKKNRLVIDDNGRVTTAGEVARKHRRSDVADKIADWQRGMPPPGL
jgi:hypothetical protein